MLYENTTLHGSYDYPFVFLSVVLAICASYSALDFAGRVAVATGRKRLFFLIGGATAMGSGIWSMHYLGMLAFRLPIPVWYDWRIVLISLIAAILGSAAALLVATGKGMSVWRATAGSIVMGTGVGAMHYIGMAAMRMAANCHYDARIVVLSIVLAIVISFAALWLVFLSREDQGTRPLRKYFSAALMGAAIPVMHYTGMAAVTFTVSDTPPDRSHAVSVSTLGAIGIALATITVVAIAILTSAHDRLMGRTDRSMRTRAHSVRLRSVRAALMTACLMSLFQAAKMALYPGITLRMSNLITIGFTTALAAFVSFMILRREERVRFELAASEEALRNSLEEYRLVFEGCPLPMWVFDRKTLQFLLVNEAAVRHYGFSREEFLSMTIADVRPKEDVPILLEALTRSARGLQDVELWRHRKKDGTLIDVEIVSHDLRFQGIKSQVVAAHDITRRKLAEEALRVAEERYRRIFEDAVVGIFQATPEGCPISINRAMAQIHGYDSPDQLLREVPNLADKLFVHPAQMDELRGMVEQGGVVRDVELELYRRDGSKRSVRLNVRGVRDLKGSLGMIEGTVEDITDRKLAEQRVQFLAYYDALTGLPNRTLLHDRLEKALASARRRKEKVALLFLDLDRFKTFNDSLGHSFGDSILSEVAERLKKGVREQDTVARIGGDEFLIMLKAIKDMPDVAVAAERMMDAMTPDFVVQGRAFNLSCSVGISVYPEHGADSETLIKNADAAMYSAKESGRNTIRVFAEEMNTQAMERLNIEHNLRLALKRKEFFLVYQPQIDVVTENIVGVEALIRWQQPEMGLVRPDRFIRIAENTGLILPIGEWTLREACSAARKWQEQGLPAVPVAVNVSAVQFRQEGFCDVVKAVLRDTGLAPECLELELTESLLLSTGGLTLPILQDLKAMGVKLAIDDFGTGYSSLSYLRYFPVNKLKIDRSFIQAAPANADDAAIASAIISMGRSLNLKTLAEGVENEAQMSFLRACHCDEVQGYYFSKPLTFDQITDKLSRAAHALTAQ